MLCIVSFSPGSKKFRGCDMALTPEK